MEQIIESRSKKPTAKRLTANLGRGRRVTITGIDSNMDGLVDCLQELLAKAKQAKSVAITLDTFLRMLKDQAKP